MLVSEALALIQSHGGFDPAVAQTTDTMQRSWLRQRRLFGPTVIGTSEYVVDDDVIWVKSLRVGTTRPWARTTLDQMWYAEANPAGWALSGADGAFAPMFEEESAQDVEDVPKMVKLLPSPTAAGLKIEALCAVNHKPIVAATAASYKLQIPEDLARAIAVDGAIAIGIQVVHGRQDLAGPFLASYTDGKAQLKKRSESLIGGGVRYVRTRGR
jgi:hypothetical protein